MRGLILHCREFRFRDVEKSTKPSGISAVVRGQNMGEGRYQHRVVILACIEEGDTEEIINKAGEHILHMADEWHSGNRDILILPFAHLSRNIASPNTANELIQLLTGYLKERAGSAELITFGTHKEVMYDVYGYPRATSYFQFP